jgi:hypothetical protein
MTHKKNETPSDKNLISLALSIIWKLSNKNIETCCFEESKVKIIYKNKSFMNVDLIEKIDNEQKSLLLNYMVIYQTISNEFLYLILNYPFYLAYAFFRKLKSKQQHWKCQQQW